MTAEEGIVMTDIRLQRMAHTLVHYSLELKEGDRQVIEGGPLAAPLIYEVVREALRSSSREGRRA